ncbi:uncharacterized protein LOC113305560 [Papaver somniferum]|uniref:uncharacterized protein LOC113305560 n=1 Tax=Papaver somniferum TaxID=3469 RepID=UPI000E7045E4|nr:uncharacterized protein LOC113305560 [Papaver somniferum]
MAEFNWIKHAANEGTICTKGNGDNTKLWKDNWVGQGNLMSIFPPQMQYDSEHHIEAKVSSCLVDGVWNLSPNLRNALGNVAMVIEGVQTDNMIQDRVIWTAGKSGEFVLKDTYNSLWHKEIKKTWHKLIWFPNCIPRHCFIVWVTLQRGLKTNFKLLSWGMDVDPVCRLCNLMLEDDHHLFFGCSFSVYIWKHILNLLGLRSIILQDWDRQIDWNRRVFTHKNLPACVVIFKIIEDVKYRMATCKTSMPDNNESLQIEVSWQKPGEGEVAINTDGSLCEDGAGYGSIIRNEHGTPLSAVTGSSIPSSITLHELQGIEAGLKLAHQKGLSRISLRSDSLTAIRYLKEDGSEPPWTCHHVWESIKRLRLQFDYCTPSHTCREVNGAADMLAGSRPDGDFAEIHPDQFTDELKKIIMEDAMGRVYYR